MSIQNPFSAMVPVLARSSRSWGIVNGRTKLIMYNMFVALCLGGLGDLWIRFKSLVDKTDTLRVNVVNSESEKKGYKYELKQNIDWFKVVILLNWCVVLRLSVLNQEMSPEETIILKKLKYLEIIRERFWLQLQGSSVAVNFLILRMHYFLQSTTFGCHQFIDIFSPKSSDAQFSNWGNWVVSNTLF